MKVGLICLVLSKFRVRHVDIESKTMDISMASPGSELLGSVPCLYQDARNEDANLGKLYLYAM